MTKKMSLSKQEIDTALYFLNEIDIDGFGINSTYDWYARRLTNLINKLEGRKLIR